MRSSRLMPLEYEHGQKIGRYEVVQTLAHGGMSHVYLARDAENARDVVLKFPHEALMADIAAHERFQREVKIGKLLHHPNIQQMYELSRFGPHEFLALEYVPGRTLREALRERRPAPEDFSEAAALGIQLAHALAYAHGQHIAHRDLKPENIILTPDGQAKVMDFGIAFLQGARRVTWGRFSAPAGTPDYMAPEQIQGGRGDARTDIYALGMILYEYLAGRLPYWGDNALAVMSQHVTAKPPPISQFRRDIPPPLEETVLKAIRRSPEDRWPDMDAFAQALEQPDTVDADALRAEREAESGEMPQRASFFGRLWTQARILFGR